MHAHARLDTLTPCMAVDNPLSLLLLVPLAALVIYLLRGRGKPAYVPHLPLWDVTRFQPAKRRFRAPPLSIVFALLAIFWLILASAGISIPLRHPGIERMTIVIDRGLSMSAGKPTRFQEVLSRPEIQSLIASGAKVVFVPPWHGAPASAPPTAIVDPEAIRRAVALQLKARSSDVVLISDEPLQIGAGRVLRIAPRIPPTISIERFAVRQGKRSQAMVSIRNQSSFQHAVLTIDSGPSESSSRIDLPATGGTRNFFIDLASVSEVISAKISSAAAPAPDNPAWLVRHSAWPILRVVSAVPPDLQRMVDVYTRLRAPSGDSRPIYIGSDPENVPADRPAIILAPNMSLPVDPAIIEQISPPPGLPLHFSSESWHDMQISLHPPSGWRTILESSGHAILALQDHLPQRIWIGFWSNQMTRSADFVLFWSNLFGYLNESEPIYASQACAPLARGWRRIQPSDAGGVDDAPGLFPGVYRSSDGELVALDAPPMPISLAASDELTSAIPLEAQLSHLSSTGQARRRLGWMLVILSLGSVLMAAMLWPRMSASPRGDGGFLTAFLPHRTFS